MADTYHLYNFSFAEVTNPEFCELALALAQAMAGASYSFNLAGGGYSVDFLPGEGAGPLIFLSAGDQRMTFHFAVSTSAGGISGEIFASPVLPIDVILAVIGGAVIQTLPAGTSKVAFSQSALPEWTVFSHEEVEQFFKRTAFDAAA